MRKQRKKKEALTTLYYLRTTSDISKESYTAPGGNTTE